MARPTTQHIGTFADFVEEHGAPSRDLGHEALNVARHLRNLHQRALDDIVAGIESRGGQLAADEQRAADRHLSEIRLFDSAIALIPDRAAATAAEYVRNGQVDHQPEGRFHTSGGHTYRKDDHQGPNWVRDLVAFGLRGDPDAAERLNRNNREVATEHRALSTTDGAGGDFVPPLYVVNEYVTMARAQRVTANLVTNLPLPAGTDSIKVPKIVTGTAVAEQATQNTAVQNTDMTTATVTADVSTLAGQQIVPVQLLDQSPINVGDAILQDLLADLAAKTDVFVLNNNATNKKGLLQEASTNAITYTSGAPTAALLFAKLADGRLQVETNRFATPTAIVMHPRRWAYLLAAVDSAGRPLVVPESNGPHNALGGDAGMAGTDGRVGTMLGLPVYVDPLIPTNLGAGTNQDVIIVLKADDSWLFEGIPHADAFRETKADQLSVLLRVYRYVAFTAARQTKSISLINGTGLVAPTF